MEILAALASLLVSKFGAAIGLLVAAFGAYFYAKHQGVVAERERNQAAEAEAVQRTQSAVNKATAKDLAIDKKIADKVKQIEADKDTSPIDGDTFKLG